MRFGQQPHSLNAYEKRIAHRSYAMRRTWILLLCLAWLFVAMQTAQSEDELHPTKESVDFAGLGGSTLGGQPMPVGAVVRAYDPSGTLAGRAEVALSGWYLMAVYGDDAATELDEGATSGETITFTINDQPAVPQGPAPPVWATNPEGLYWHVELEANACTLFGDLDCDCDVDVADAMAVASRWRCRRLKDECYDARYDLDGDGDIDVVDIMLVSARWGEVCSP